MCPERLKLQKVAQMFFHTQNTRFVVYSTIKIQENTGFIRDLYEILKKHKSQHNGETYINIGIVSAKLLQLYIIV